MTRQALARKARYRSDPAWRALCVQRVKERRDQCKNDPLFRRLENARKAVYRVRESYHARLAPCGAVVRAAYEIDRRARCGAGGVEGSEKEGTQEEGMSFVITAVCENGHSQGIRIAGSLGREFADVQVGLLDGTSPLYLHSPIGTDSFIGKCGICRAQIKCTVAEDPLLPFPEGRCRVCGCPLSKRPEFGCLPGNCSRRPVPKTRADAGFAPEQ